MSQTSEKPAARSTVRRTANRVQLSSFNRMLARPEIGALVAAVVIGIFFLIVAPPFRSADSLATVLYQSATIGIVAVAVGMLMIGGEFDLSAGVMVTSAGLVNAIFCYELGINLWVGAVLSLLFALAIGFLNGYLVMKTGIASFLITLGTFFVLIGVNLGVTKLVTGSVTTPQHQPDGRLRRSSTRSSRRRSQIGSTRDLHHRAVVVPVRGHRHAGCCSGPRSATGSSRSAATRPAPARSAYPCSGSRSACS